MRHAFTVYNPETGEILRAGSCSRPEDVALQARAGEAVLGEAAGHDVDDRVIIPANGAKPYLRRKAAAAIADHHAQVQAHRDRAEVAGQNPLHVLREALKTKGIDLTETDLTAAADALQARRKGPAGAGKQAG